MNLDLGGTWIRDSLKYLLQLHLPLCLTANLGPHVGETRKGEKDTDSFFFLPVRAQEEVAAMACGTSRRVLG